MLDAAETLFLGRRHEKSIAKERCRGVTMKGVKTEDIHDAAASAGPSSSGLHGAQIHTIRHILQGRQETAHQSQQFRTAMNRFCAHPPT